MNGSNEAVPSFFFSVFLWSDANGLEDGRMASMKRTGLYERMDANRLGAVVGTGNSQVGANGRGGVVGVVNGLNGWYLSFILVFLLSEGARMGAVGGTVNGRVVANGLGGVVGAVNGLNGVVLIIFFAFFCWVGFKRVGRWSDGKPEPGERDVAMRACAMGDNVGGRCSGVELKGVPTEVRT